MKYKNKLRRIEKNIYELPKQKGMKVPARLYISEKLLKLVEEDAIQQVMNVAHLPGIVNYSLAMPDMHSGYGFTIGGVAAFDMEKGIVTPGGVGFDINCGVRLLATNIKVEDFLKKRKEVLHDFKRTVPSGVGRGHKEKLDYEELDRILKMGAEYAVENGMGVKDDLEKCEEGGRIKKVNTADVSELAKKRGLSQAGTLGAGNHFLEVQKVDEIFEPEIAKKFGIKKGNIVVMIHCGSRGLGHQVASDYIKLMGEKYGFKGLPDRELINAPIKSELGKKYLSAMNCAVNYAFCNRQIIMNFVRGVLKRYFPKNKNHLVYDVCHNIAKVEEHVVDGKKNKLCVHRKGATRSFGPGRKEIPAVYRDIGQPVIIPGSMGTFSYLLVGTKESEKLSWGSTSHGAGRVLSRSQAIRTLDSDKIIEELHEKDIEIEAGSKKGISEEAPQAYKDIDEVIEVSDKVGLAHPVARLKPLAVMKG